MDPFTGRPPIDVVHANDSKQFLDTGLCLVTPCHEESLRLLDPQLPT